MSRLQLPDCDKPENTMTERDMVDFDVWHIWFALKEIERRGDMLSQADREWIDEISTISARLSRSIQ
jgi:hypothetical protein